MVGMAVATTVASMAARKMLSMTPSTTISLDRDTRALLTVSADDVAEDSQVVYPQQLAQFLLVEAPPREVHRQVGPVPEVFIAVQMIVRRQPVLVGPESSPVEGPGPAVGHGLWILDEGIGARSRPGL